MTTLRADEFAKPAIGPVMLDELKGIASATTFL
jgi:hypothetical protein